MRLHPDLIIGYNETEESYELFDNQERWIGSIGKRFICTNCSTKYPPYVLGMIGGVLLRIEHKPVTLLDLVEYNSEVPMCDACQQWAEVQ